VRSPPGGDLQNAELLDMVVRGPSRIGGAWTLHLRYNEAVHVPEMREENRDKALAWLHNKLANHLSAELLKVFAAASASDASTSAAHQSEAFHLCKAFLGGDGDFCSLSFSESSLGRWLAASPAAHPSSRCLVTAVQRQARSGDLFVAVRHPITQATPAMRLKVDPTKQGFALGMPPLFANLSELDYDGDKMKIASERAPQRRAIWEERLSPAKLMHNPLGKRVVKLSGVAPLALNLAQTGGVACPNPFLLTPVPVADSVLWKGVLEPTVSVDVFLDGLSAVGCARPDLLAQRWSHRHFEEVRFKVRRVDGVWVDSLALPVSYDGYYPVPAQCSANVQCEWIGAELALRWDLFGPHSLGLPLQIELHDGSSRPSALDDLTFAQMRSLTQASTPKNFHGDQKDFVVVQHLPGLVHHGSFQTYVAPQIGPWQRMARVLLRLATRPRAAPQPPRPSRGPPPRCLLGHDAVIAEMLYCSWRPSEKDVVQCMLELERSTEGGVLAAIYRDTEGVGRLEDLALALQDKQGIAHLVQEHELFDECAEKEGFARAAQMLRRFAFEHSSPPYKKLRNGLPLDVEKATELWRRLDLSELLQIGVEQVEDSCQRRARVVFKPGRMKEPDWLALAAEAPQVGRVLHKALPLLKPRTARRSNTFCDWARFTAALSAPRRQSLDVEASLEHLAGLWSDDAEYCASLAALDALGHTIANLLNQPTQNEARKFKDQS